MNGNGSRRTVRTALGAALVTVALALIPSAALGVAPQLDSVNLPVGQNHPTFQWTLPMGDKGRVWSDHIVVSTSSEQYAPGTFLAGEFLDRYWASFNTLQKNDTSFADLKEYKPGTYFVHVAGHDPGCPPGQFSCQIEFSNILSFNVVVPPPGGGGGGGGGGADKFAPLQTLSFAAVQDIDKLRVTTRSTEAGTITATGTVGMPGASKALRFKPAKRAVAANVKTTLKLKLSKKSLRSAKRALKKRKHLKAKIVLTAVDKAGNKRATKITIGLRN
jgi:hypothetical protein